ncbi:MAG: hypothetical protein LBD75_01555 [Candidatus Peribacteria bacterium]|nr:hypothetical protein [Candidatus Peribacteria bacterium]
MTKNSQIICASRTAGTVKTVSWSDDLTCSCVCDGTEWQWVIDTAECGKQC